MSKAGSEVKLDIESQENSEEFEEDEEDNDNLTIDIDMDIHMAHPEENLTKEIKEVPAEKNQKADEKNDQIVESKSETVRKNQNLSAVEPAIKHGSYPQTKHNRSSSFLNSQSKLVSKMPSKYEISSRKQSDVTSKNGVKHSNNISSLKGEEIPRSNNESVKVEDRTNLLDNEVSRLKSPQANKQLNHNPSTNRIANIFFNSTERTLNKNASQLSKSSNKATVLTKMVEDFKSVDMKKVPIYEYMMHDEYINRYVDKGKGDNLKKINNFISRNEEHKGRKQIKIQTMVEKIRQEKMKNYYAKPYTNSKNKGDPRTVNQFIHDQITFVNKKDSNLIDLKASHLEKFNKNVRDAPQINQKSKALGEKKNKQRENSVHKRLFQEKLNKQKTHLLNENCTKSLKTSQSLNYLTSSQTKKELKRNKSEILMKANELHQEFKQKKEKIIENEKLLSEEAHKLKKEEFISDSSKLIILTHFIKDYEAALINVFNAKFGVHMNQEEFSKVMFEIHLTLFDPRNISDETSEGEIIKKKDEVSLLSEAWRFLTSGDNSIEAVDSNKVLVFLTAVLGLYKGEKKENPEEIHTKDISKDDEEKKKKKIKRDINLLKKLVNETDLSQYSYSDIIAKHLKIFFKYFAHNRVNHLLEEKNRYYSSKQKDFINKDLVFHPTLSPSSLSAAENYRKKCMEELEQETNKPHLTKKKLKLEDAYSMQQKKKENELAKLRNQKEEQIMKQCTFQPNVDKLKSPSASKNQTLEVAKKLYSDAFTREKKKIAGSNQTKKETIPSFSPKLHSYKSSIFEKNPLANDVLLKKNIEMKERARIEKKICEVQKQKGVNNLKNLNNIEQLLKEEVLPGFKFQMEQKRNKDTFESYRLSQNFSPKSLNIMSETPKQIPLLYLDVNIDNNKQEKVEIYSNDDPAEVAEHFSKKHSLSEEKRMFLQRLIGDKMAEHLFYKQR